LKNWKKMLTNLKPLITETSISLAKKNWYTFIAPVEVNKDLLKEMLKKSFKVDILAIKTAVVKGKRKRNPTSRRMRKQSDWKKVFIKVKEGQKIALFDVGA